MIHRRPGLELKRSPHLEILRRVHIFSHLGEEELGELYRKMILRHVRAGALIVTQHEPGDALHVLVSGRARVVLFGANGREMTLAVLRPGDFFGEVSLFDGKTRSANVVAEEDSTLLALDRERLMSHLRAHPETALRLLAKMADRLRQADEIINRLALHDVPSRLCRTLLTLAEQQGEQQADGILLRRRPTQQDLANMVGTCRETVSRALTAMARRGLVVTRGRSLLLRQALVESLSQVA